MRSYALCVPELAREGCDPVDVDEAVRGAWLRTTWTVTDVGWAPHAFLEAANPSFTSIPAERTMFSVATSAGVAAAAARRRAGC